MPKIFRGMENFPEMFMLLESCSTGLLSSSTVSVTTYRFTPASRHCFRKYGSGSGSFLRGGEGQSGKRCFPRWPCVTLLLRTWKGCSCHRQRDPGTWVRLPRRVKHLLPYAGWRGPHFLMGALEGERACMPFSERHRHFPKSLADWSCLEGSL